MKSILKKKLIKFEIIDTGSGIKEEIIPQLTEPFATFGNEEEPNKNGIGIGLNFCKEIIGILGPFKAIYISSIYGKGSKFGFVIFQTLKRNFNLNKYKL